MQSRNFEDRPLVLLYRGLFIPKPLCLYSCDRAINLRNCKQTELNPDIKSSSGGEETVRGGQPDATPPYAHGCFSLTTYNSTDYTVSL